MNFYDSSHVSLWSIYFDGHFQDLFDPFFSGGEGVIKVINVVKWLVYQLSVPFSQQYQQIQWFPIHINTAANFISFIQGVPTSLEYAKCNVLKLRKVCERSGLCLQKDLIKKGEISNLNYVTGSKFKISLFLSGQNSKFTPFNQVKIRNSPLFIGSRFKIYPFLLGQYFVNVARFARKLF